MKNNNKKATIYRMVMDKHVCPFGLKALHILKKRRFQIEDHHLTNREELDDFKKKFNVETTPQIFIGEERIGGYDDLCKYLGIVIEKKNKKTYVPIICVFVITFLISFALHWQTQNTLFSLQLVMWFVGITMAVLAMLKLRDLEAFSNQFIGYDLLAQRFISYAYFYAFAEAFAGVGMLVGAFQIFVAPISLFIGSVGFVSVFYAVYIQKRDLQCACVGGNSNVPLGFISLLENIVMMLVGGWILF